MAVEGTLVETLQVQVQAQQGWEARRPVPPLVRDWGAAGSCRSRVSLPPRLPNSVAQVQSQHVMSGATESAPSYTTPGGSWTWRYTSPAYPQPFVSGTDPSPPGSSTTRTSSPARRLVVHLPTTRLQSAAPSTTQQNRNDRTNAPAKSTPWSYSAGSASLSRGQRP